MKQLLGLIVSVCTSLGAVAAPPPDSRGPAANDVHAQPMLPGDLDGGDWHVHHTDHFAVAYDRDADRAAFQGELLEATHRRFYDALPAAEFRVDPVAEPLLCLFFEDKDDYLRYARRADRVDMSWTVAYYSARTNRVAFYRYGPHSRDLDAADLAELNPDHLYGSAAGGDAAPASQPSGKLLREHRISLASATHEAAHQLAFNSGLQKRGVLYPLWVSEGLATNFELHVGDPGFGPDRDNPTRRERLDRAYRAGELLPLYAFAAVTRPPTDDARATDAAYAQAWGLFRFLYLTERQALSNYLADLATLDRGHREAATLRAEFERHFGALHAVDDAWLAWVAVE